MTPKAALVELLERVGALHGAPVAISSHELSAWPNAAVAAMKSQGLLTKARPATSAVCPGCERECVMPVHVLPDKAREPAAFIVCDKRNDINRVAVSISCLEQWQASGDSIAALLSGLLGLDSSGASGTDAARWEVGMLKGAKHYSHLVLVADGELALSLADHSIPLANVLALDTQGLKVDKHALLCTLDGDERQPSAGIGSEVWRKHQAKTAADARHNQPGGSRDKQKQIRQIWATGKYSSRDRCAEEEYAALGMSYSTARKALKNTPNP